MFVHSLLTSALLAAAASATPQSLHSNVKRASPQPCPNTETPAYPYRLYNNPWSQSDDPKGSSCIVWHSVQGDHIKWRSDFTWAYGHGHVKAYPNSRLDHNVRFQSLHSLSSTVSWDVSCHELRDLGASVVYDLFGSDNNKGFEMMLWLAAPGGAHPLAYHYTSGAHSVPIVALSGLHFRGDSHTYDLYIGLNGGTKVYSFVINGILQEQRGVWIKNWSGDLNQFLHFLATDNRLGQDRLSAGAVLASSSFGIETTRGNQCAFSADLSIHQQ